MANNELSITTIFSLIEDIVPSLKTNLFLFNYAGLLINYFQSWFKNKGSLSKFFQSLVDYSVLLNQ